MLKYNEDIWIGMNDINWEMHFVWTDGKGMPYTNWAKGHPTSVPDQRFSFSDEVILIYYYIQSFSLISNWMDWS